MLAARRSGAMARGLAATLALLSVLMLLAVPALAGRVHAAMPGMIMTDRMQMAGAPAEAAAPAHHAATEAICMAACSLAGQLLPAQVQRVAASRRVDAPVIYFMGASRLEGLNDEPGSPPPR